MRITAQQTIQHRPQSHPRAHLSASSERLLRPAPAHPDEGHVTRLSVVSHVTIARGRRGGRAADLLPILSWRQGRSQGGIRPCPPKADHRGHHIFCPPPKPMPGPLDPLGPLAEADFLSGFRVRREASRLCRTNPGSRDGPGPARRVRAPHDRSGPAGKIRAPRDKSWPTERIRAPNTNEGTAGRIRTPKDGLGLRRTDQARETDEGPTGRSRAPKNEVGSRRTNQGPVGRIRTPNVESGPAGRIRAPQDEVGPRRTK